MQPDFPGGDTQCPSVILYSTDVLCPAQPGSTSVFSLVQSDLWPLFFLFPRCLFFSPGMWCLTNLFPSLIVRLLACSLLDRLVPMFLHRHCWKYAWGVDLSLQACSNVTLEDVAVLGECCPSGRDSSLNLLLVSGAVSLSQVDVAFNALDLSVVDIKWCVGFHHHLYLRLVHPQALLFAFISYSQEHLL